VASWAERLLSAGDEAQLRAQGYLEVASPSRPERVYRVPVGGGQVAVYDHGKEAMRLCLQPVEPVTAADWVVLHKLLIQANERLYLSTANRFPPAAAWQPGDVDPLVALAREAAARQAGRREAAARAPAPRQAAPRRAASSRARSRGGNAADPPPA
jgi:hypothetical protein